MGLCPREEVFKVVHSLSSLCLSGIFFKKLRLGLIFLFINGLSFADSSVTEMCARLSELGAVRAYDSLKKICKELKLKQPEQITSVNMRKYTATISQV